MTSLRATNAARYVAAVLIASITLAAAACSGSNGEPEPSPASPTQEPTATPAAPPSSDLGESPNALEILKGSYEHMMQASSFQTVIGTEIRTIGQALNVRTAVSRDVEGSLRLLTTLQTPQGPQSTELIFDRVNAYAYVKVPGEEWRRTTVQALAEITGLDLEQYEADFFADLIPAEDTPWDIYEVEYLGREEVDGVEAHHLGVTVDFQDLLSRLSESENERLLASAGLTGAPLEVLEEARIAGVEVWIDDEGVPRRFSSQFLGGNQFVTVTIETSDVGGEVAIALPAQFKEGLPEPEPQIQAPPPPEHGFDLGGMLLTQPETAAEFPDMVDSGSGGRLTPGRAAANTVNTEDTAEDLAAWGRVDGHLCFFVDQQAFARQVTGRPAAVSCSVELYETEAQASEAVRREIADYQRMVGQSLDGGVVLESFEGSAIPSVGDGAAAGRAVATDPASETVYLDLILWVQGRVVASLTLISLSDLDRRDSLDRLAAVMDGRMEAALERQR